MKLEIVPNKKILFNNWYIEYFFPFSVFEFDNIKKEQLNDEQKVKEIIEKLWIWDNFNIDLLIENLWIKIKDNVLRELKNEKSKFIIWTWW